MLKYINKTKTLLVILLIGLSISFVYSRETIQVKPKPKPNNKTTPNKEEPKKDDTPQAIKDYKKCPLSIRRYAEAFYQYGRECWGRKELKKAVDSFNTTAKIYQDILNVQRRRTSSEKKRTSYDKFIKSITEARLIALLAKAKVFLEQEKHQKALRELINVCKACIDTNKYQQGDIALKLLRDNFSLDREDLKDLGVEKLYH